MERNRRHTATAILIVTTGYSLFCLLKSANAQEAEHDNSYYSMFQQTVDKYHNEEFEDAIKIATRIREQYPDEPAGAFGLLVTYQIIMRNYRTRLYETKFDSLLNLSIKLSEKAIKRNKKVGRNYFYLGSAYGSRSIYYAQRGKWLAAFKDGTKVLKNFNKAVAYSPNFYDAYYGLGLYKYWLCAKSKLLRFLPFSKDTRQEGIEQIKIAIEKGKILNVDAMHGLTSIYYNEGEFEKALQLSDQLYERYPNNPSLLYRRGRIYQKLEKWNEAIKIFKQLYDILKFTKYQSISYRIESLYHLAKSHFQLENYLEAQRLSQEAVMLEKFCDFSKELDGPLEKYSAIQDQLHKLNDEVKTIMLTHAIGSTEN